MVLKKFTVTLPGRLDKIVARQYSEISRAVIQRLIRAGKVAVDGRPITDQAYPLRAGHTVAVDYHPPTLAPQPRVALKKIYEDAELLVIDKPPGLVVHPTPFEQKESVAGGLLAVQPDIAGVGNNPFRPGIVHRLDRDTSGLLVIAKTPRAYEQLTEQFRLRQIVKEYLVLVHGQMERRHGEFDQPIGRKTGASRFQAGHGRPALTEYWVQAVLKLGIDFFTLVRVQLHTGRTHQIRVHFAAAGHPVAGDRVYGGRFKKFDAELFPRQFVHACYLRFRLPAGSERAFSSDLPADLKAMLQLLTEFKK